MKWYGGFVVSALLLVVTMSLAHGVCVNGPTVLTSTAGFFSSDGTISIPEPPPSGNLVKVPAESPIGVVIPANTQCTWLINVTTSMNIFISFYALQLQVGDTLTIHNGTSASDVVVRTYTSADVPAGYSTGGNAFTIVYTTGSTNSTSTGFGLYYQSGTCMYGVETLSSTLSGSISDGSGSAGYAPGQLCAWLLVAPTTDSYISIDFNSIIEAGFDYVVIYDGQDSTARRIGISLFFITSFHIDTSGPYAYITFYTDKRTELYGFQLDYTIVSNAYCSGTAVFTDPQGQISDGSGTANYQPNSDCGFVISSAVDRIEVYFSDLDLGSGDYLSIYAGTDATGTLLATYSGRSTPPHASFASGELYLHFTSDGGDEGRGFVITYHAGGCSVTAEIHGDPYGSVNSGSANNTYGVFWDCLWLFDYSGVDGVSGIRYSFDVFDMEFQYDTVTVYDGATIDSPTLFQASGSAPAGTYQGRSSGKYLLVRMVTDDDTNFQGFVMSYNPVYPSSSTDETPLIVGLTVGLGGALFLLLICLLLLVILFLLLWKRKAPLVLELKEPDYNQITWNNPIIDEGGPSYQELAKRLRILEKLILNPVVVSAISKVVSNGTDLSEVSYATLLIHQTNNKSIKMLRHLLLAEIIETGDDEIPLREDSMASMCFKMFAHLVGVPYLWEIYAFPIAELEQTKVKEDRRRSLSINDNLRGSLVNSPKSPKAKGIELSLFSISSTLEVNPDKLEEGQDKKVNQLQLQLLLQKLFQKIINSVEYFPPALRYLLYKLYSDLEPTHPQLLHLVMGNLVFLRFLCPALILPQKYGVTRNAPHSSTQRTLILIAKVLQNLSNKVRFGSKEPYMSPMNKFIDDNIDKVESLFDQLGSPAKKPLFGDPPSSIVPNTYRRHAMVTMYNWVAEHADDIELKVREILPDKNQSQKIVRALAYLKGMDSDLASPFSTGSHLTSKSSHSDNDTDVVWVGD